MGKLFRKLYDAMVTEYVAWLRDHRRGRGPSQFAYRAKSDARRQRQRELLDRQTRREKSGFYEGMPSVASMLGQVRGRMRRQKAELA